MIKRVMLWAERRMYGWDDDIVYSVTNTFTGWSQGFTRAWCSRLTAKEIGPLPRQTGKTLVFKVHRPFRTADGVIIKPNLEG